MDAVTVLGAVAKALVSLKSTSAKVNQNTHQCTQFCAHADALLHLIQNKYQQGVPSALVGPLTNLKNTLLTLRDAIEDLSNDPHSPRSSRYSEVSDRVKAAYKDVASVVQRLNLDIHIDLYQMQQDSSATHKRDMGEIKQSFERLNQQQHEMANLLQTLQVERNDFQEIVTFMSRCLQAFPEGSTESIALGNSVQTLQRLSGMDEIPAECIITSFEIEVHHGRSLGTGGSASVFEADWNGAKVAVKVLDKGVPLPTIRREVSVWRKLKHPHVLEFFGACAFDSKGPSFLVCALMPNGNVMDYIAKKPDVDRRKLLYDAALGLVYLHKKNVVHGDLKGRNILVNAEGGACLADFGLSKARNHTTRNLNNCVPRDSFTGTARWMSPEALQHGTVGKSTDIYSFGMTMYEVFSGLAPFSATPDSSLLDVICVLDQRPTRPADALGLCDTIWTVITESWTSTVHDRPSATHIANELALGDGRADIKSTNVRTPNGGVHAYQAAKPVARSPAKYRPPPQLPRCGIHAEHEVAKIGTLSLGIFRPPPPLPISTGHTGDRTEKTAPRGPNRPPSPPPSDSVHAESQATKDATSSFSHGTSRPPPPPPNNSVPAEGQASKTVTRSPRRPPPPPPSRKPPPLLLGDGVPAGNKAEKIATHGHSIFRPPPPPPGTAPFGSAVREQLEQALSTHTFATESKDLLQRILGREEFYSTKLSLVCEIYQPQAICPIPDQHNASSDSATAHTSVWGLGISADEVMSLPMSLDDVNVIFSNITDIYRSSLDFMKTLKQVLEVRNISDAPRRDAGQLLLEQVPNMSNLYQSYIRNHHAALSRLLSLPRTTTLERYFAYCETLCRQRSVKWDLGILLNEPIEYFTTYPSFIASVVQKLSTGHPDRAYLDKVTRALKGIIEDIGKTPGRQRELRSASTRLPSSSDTRHKRFSSIGGVRRGVTELLTIAEKSIDLSRGAPLARTFSLRSPKGTTRSNKCTDDTPQARSVALLSVQLSACKTLVQGLAAGADEWVRAMDRMEVQLKRIVNIVDVKERADNGLARGLPGLHRQCVKARRRVQAELSPTLERLKAKLTRPEALVMTMTALLPFHYNLLTRNPAQPTPDHLQDFSMRYLALRSQLYTELPVFLVHFRKAVDVIFLHLYTWQMEFFDEFGALWRAYQDADIGDGDAVYAWQELWKQFREYRQEVESNIGSEIPQLRSVHGHQIGN